MEHLQRTFPIAVLGLLESADSKVVLAVNLAMWLKSSVAFQKKKKKFRKMIILVACVFVSI